MGERVKEMKKTLSIIITVIIAVAAITACGSSDKTAESTTGSSDNQLYVYNWGEYIDPEVITMFEEETGINVVYDEYETNEIMYPKVAAGASRYDCICPSDYMIRKMIQNDLLQPLDWSRLPNATANIGKTYMEQSETFDPGNKYSIPYCWGTVGILYNTTMVDEPVDSWNILWDPKYKDNILMQDSVRDAFMIPLIMNGDSVNTTDPDELNDALLKLEEQKPLVQAYVIDEVRDKMISGESALGVIFSGEALYTAEENENLDYAIPKEGTNVWIDSWVIPKNAEHVDNAYTFLNYLARAEIAKMNFDYIYYPTPNTAAWELLDDDMKYNSIAFPDLTQYDNLQTYTYLGEDMDKTYDNLWIKLKSY
ncbi:MAG: ABC transporter substrate-binding protein [Lachnospiraceae bacterium]